MKRLLPVVFLCFSFLCNAQKINDNIEVRIETAPVENVSISEVKFIEMPYRNRFEIKTFNDNWSGGFTEIHDDLRSYGLDLSYVFPAKENKSIKVSGRFSGLTFRTGNDSIRQRADELNLKIERPLYFFNNGKGHIKGNLNGYLIGKLTSDKIQNLWHETFGVRLLDLEYKIPTSAFLGVGGLVSRNLYKKKLNKRSTFSINLDVNEHLVFNYFNHFQLGLPIILTSSNEDYFILRTSANFYNIMTDNILLHEVLEAESGLQFSIEGGFGNLIYFFDFFTQNQFSSGGIGMRFPFFGGNEKNDEEINFEIEVGLLTDGNGYYSKYIIPRSINFLGSFSFALHHSYGTYLKKRLLNYPNQNGHYRQVGLGGEFQIFKPKNGWQINPFVSGAAGLKTFSTYRGDFIAIKRTDNSLFVQADLGLKIKIPVPFLEEHCQYGLSFFYRTVFQPLSKTSPVYERLNDFERNAQMIGGGIFAGMSF